MPGTPRLLRALNDRAALDLLVSDGPLTRARLGELTGLSKVTASQLLARLGSAGLVRAVGSEAGGRGPSAQLYAIDGSAGLAAGVDVDPSRAVARVVDVAGAVLGEAAVALPRAASAHDPAADVRRAIDAAAGAAGAAAGLIGSVVVGVQGAYDPALDALAYAAHLPAWSRPGLLGALRSAAGCQVAIENDVNLAAAAQQVAAPTGAGCSALFWVGDGLGLAIHLGGVLHRGARGGAGEIGYIPVPGAHGGEQLQDLVGGPAVLALARAHGVRARSAATAVTRAVGAGPGDEGAAAFLTELADRLATGLATITAVLDPDEVVLAGPVATAGGGALADLVVARLQEISPMRPQVRVARADGNPVLAGATALALSDLRERLFSAVGTDGTTQTRTGART